MPVVFIDRLDRLCFRDSISLQYNPAMSESGSCLSALQMPPLEPASPMPDHKQGKSRRF